MALASSRLSGRRTTVSTSPPTSRTSEATSSSSFWVPDASTSLPPSAPRAALAVRPAPRERKEGAALAGDLVDVAADILDAGDAVGHHDLVRRLPMREVLDDVAAGRGLVLVVEMGLRRPRAVRPEEGA